ncbi:MAG: hypothetical protein WC637_17965 [Victivallales bacterium]|jgi:hypothetical protein
MKTFILAIVLSAICCSAAMAQQGTTAATGKPAPVAQAATERWDAFLAGFWFDSPESIKTANVSGLKWGLPISAGQGKVVGFEWSFICCATDTVEGFQWAMLGANVSQDFTGLQMSVVNVVEKKISGVQLGIVNKCDKEGVQIGIVNVAENADFQLGLVNLNKNGWLPFMVFINHGK